MSRLALVAAGLAGCGKGGDGGPRRTNHLPVHPSLDLAIVVPESMKRVELGVVHVTRADVFDNCHFTVRGNVRMADATFAFLTRAGVVRPAQ